MVPVTPVTFDLAGDRALRFDTGGGSDVSFGFSDSISAGGAKPYTGAYEVTPKIYEAVSLETKDRFLKDNVTVKKIPQYIVSNDAGGATLIMGDEYYG